MTDPPHHPGDLTAALDAELQPLLEGFSGRAAVALYRFADGFGYHHHATDNQPAASLIKLPILGFALAEVAAGNLSLARRLPLSADDQVGGSGVLKALQPGLTPTVRDLLTLMIIVSDNTATNVLIDLLGLGPINAFIRAIGLQQTELVGKLQLPETKRNEAQRRGRRNTTCAADILGLLLQLERGDLLPPAETQMAREILLQQQFTEALSRYLPRDPELDHPSVRVASKSGCLRGSWHDAGIVYAGESQEPLYALVVMTTDSRDRSFSWEHEGMMLIAEVSRRVYALLR